MFEEFDQQLISIKQRIMSEIGKLVFRFEHSNPGKIPELSLFYSEYDIRSAFIDDNALYIVTVNQESEEGHIDAENFSCEELLDVLAALETESYTKVDKEFYSSEDPIEQS